MTKKSKPLAHEQSGPYAELVTQPNPEGYCIAFMPALAVWFQHAEKQKGTALSVTEVTRIRDSAAVIALHPDQLETLQQDRGYEDVDPMCVYESWCEFKSDL